MSNTKFLVVVWVAFITVITPAIVAPLVSLMPFYLASLLALVRAQCAAVAVIFTFVTLMMLELTFFLLAMAPVLSPVLTVVTVIVVISVVITILINLSVGLLGTEAEKKRSSEDSSQGQMFRKIG